MKIKKEMEVSPCELEEGDELEVFGSLVYLSRIENRFQHSAAFVDGNGYLETVLFEDNEYVAITREVETPSYVTLYSRGETKIGVADHNPPRPDGKSLVLTVDDVPYAVDPIELIDAIKAVKGLD